MPKELTPQYFSSFLFFTNSLLALYYNYYIYSILFLCLTSSSLYFHSNKKTFWSYYIDQICIFSIFLYGGYVLSQKIFYNPIPLTNIQKILSVCIIITFLATIVLYYYGIHCKCLCWNSNEQVANKWHSLVHFIGSLGHNMIIIL